MKKNLKRLIAIVSAVAMTVTGITFTPAVKSVDAATSWISVTGVPSGAWGGKKSQYTLGTTSDTDGNGKWDLEVSQNQWGNWEGRYKNADSIDGFSFNNQVYNNAGGVFLWSHDLKSEYGLTAGSDYEMTVTIDYEGVNAAQHNYVLTEGGTNNMNISRTVAKGASQETYTADVKPGSGDFILRLSWTTANYQTAEVATFTVTSVTFTPKETTTNLANWQRVPYDNTDFVPETGSPWALKSNNDGKNQWGNSWYKMNTSKAVSDVSRLHLQKRYTDGNNQNNWWWDSAALLGYGTTLGLENGTAYTGQIVVTTDTATSGNHKFRIIAFNKEYNVSLSAGDNTINIDKFKYNPADNNDIKFVYVEMPEDAEFYIKSINFTSVYQGWTKAPIGEDEAISNSNWSTSVNNDGSSSYGDIRYKHDTSVATNDPARIKFKMAGAIGEAERTPQGARITDPAQRWWWMSADLTGNYKATVNKADGTSQTGNIRTILEEDERYTASIVVNSSDATLTDDYGNDTKLFVTPFGGTEQAFDLASGDNTLSLQEFAFDGSDANIKFLFDELVADSELTVKSVTFTQVDDGWHKAKPNQDVTPSGSPWTLYADYQPDTDLSDGDQGLYGDMWYKVDGSGVSGTSIKPKSVAVGECFYWNKATLKNYLSKTVAQGGAGLQDGHSYTGTITISYTAGDSEAGKTPKLRYVVAEAGTGEADKVLNNGSGTYTINLSEFLYNSADENQDILFDLTGLEKDSIFKVTNIAFTEVDADWTNVKGDTATANPWTLTANYDGVEAWGHMRYKQSGSGVSSVQIKPMATAMGNHYYWNNAVLEDYLSDVANLTDGVEYDAQIKVQYTAGEAEAGKTPQLRYIMAAAETGEANFDFDEGSKTYTIDLPTFTYDASAGKDDIEFELDGLEKKSIFKVTEITFSPTGWTKVPKNTAFVPTGTPWTLTAANDQSTPGEEQWGDMSYKVDGTASNISSTLIKPNATAVGEHFYWNKAELKNYLATLQDGHSYTGSITFNYVSGTAVSGKTPELRTVIAAAGTGEMDTAVTAGSNTISISEFIYESTAANNDILFELDGLEEGSIFQVTGITFTEVDADWTNVKGGTATATPWILTANNDGNTQWGHLRYKQTGTGVSSVQVKPMSTSMGDHFYWNSAKLTDMTYGQTLTPGKEYTAVITVQYTAGVAESGKTPELLYNIPVAEVSEATKTLNSGSGTYTINVPAFAYDSNANNSVEFELDSLEKKSVFKVTDITFTDTGWTKVTQNSNPDNPTTVNPSGTPWTLRADWILDEDLSDGDQGMYGDMSYKVTGTASNVSATQLKINKSAVGEHFYWETATLKNYLNTLEDGCSYTGSITVNYTPGTAEAGKTPQLRTIIEGAYDGNIDTNLSSGSNTISIDEFIYSSADTRKDIMFELTGLEAGSIFQVTGLTFTKQDADWTNVKGGSDTATPWIITANNDGDEAWGHLRYKKTATSVSGVQIKPMSVSMGDHFYWNTAKLTDMAYGQSLTAGNEYTAVITVQYTAGEAESGKTPELLYNIPAAGISEETKALNNGSGTYTINVPAFTYDSSADNYAEFELDSLEKKSVFKVNSIVFTPTGWKQVPKNTEFVPTGTPWTLEATNDQSTPGEEQWGDMSYKIDGTASNVNGTLIRPNATDVGEHYYWNTATLKDYMTTLEDGCSYTGSITVNYTPGTVVAGKTPELRTVIAAAGTGEKDTTVTSGSNTISIDEFIYNSSDDNQDILFELDGLEEGSVFQVSNITFTKLDADWTNVKGDEANPDPWTLTANYDGVTQWGHMRYKQTGTGVSSVQIKPINTAVGEHYYWNNAVLEDYLSDTANLTDGVEYDAQIKVQYTAGQAEAGKTPQLRYIMAAANTGEADFDFDEGSKTYTIDLPTFTYDASAGTDDIEFELDGLEKQSIFKVTEITFTPTGWTKVPNNTEFVPTGTPWTLEATNDQSTPGEEQWGNMSYKVDGTASNISSTLIRPNATDVGEHYYWNTATLKNYLATLEDGCSYTGSITFNYVAGDSVAGKTPELRTVIAAAGTGEMDTAVTAGSNTISISEFIYNSADENKDILFELDGLEEGSVFQVTGITFTKQDADWTNVKGGSDTATPWTLTANNDGDQQWGHLRYKQTGTGVSSVQVKPMSVSMGDHFYWNSAKLSSIAYGQSLTAGNEYTAVITLNYTSGTAEAGKTPELLYNIPAAGISEETKTLSAGTNTINVPAFTYDASVDNSLELELDSLEAKSIIQVTDITFTPTGWKQVPKNTEFVPTGTPWTLEATNDQSTPGEEQWGDMSYKVTGTASDISATQIRPNATDVGEHYYWNTATLKNYMATLEDGCSYTGSITVNYTAGEAVAGKTPELRTVIAAAKTGEKDTALTAGSNTISIDEFIYNSADENKDILFELDGLEKGSVFQVTGITFTKQDADWTNVKGESATATPWTLTANNDGDEAWGHLRYKQTGTGVSSVQVKPINTSMGDHFYWNSAKLSSIAYGQSLTAGEEYTAVITVQYTAGEAESGKTPEVLYNIPAAGISEETKALNSGSGTYTINVPAFTYDANADNSLELELDSLEKKSIIQVTDITFTSTGWKQVPKNTEFVPTGTPWTLEATNDQSTPGEEQWGDMSYKVTGTASDISATQIRPNATDVGEHYYWNTATLKNYLATLEDGCSYTGSITVNYTAGEAVSGKTPELRTVIEAAGTGEMDTTVTAGSNTISIGEFLYDSTAANKDILFELDGLEKGSVFQVTGITFTKLDADWTNVKDDEVEVDPWTITANYDGVTQWGHMRYKQTGTGVSSVQIKPINTSVGEHFYWNNAKLIDYLSDTANLEDGKEYEGTITVSYTAGQAEAGKTPQLRYIVAAANTGEANLNLSSGTNTYEIDLGKFIYDASAGNDSIEFELDGLEKQSIFQVTDITFEPTGWERIEQNDEVVPTDSQGNNTPWTLVATNDGDQQWGDMSVKVDGTASDVASTSIKLNTAAEGEHFYWNTATLKDYLATLDDGCSYTGSIVVNYTSGEAEAGKTPELRTVIAGAFDGSKDTTLSNGLNTIALDEFVYDASKGEDDILFELTGLEKGSIFNVASITFTKQDADWTNVKGDTADVDPWTITATNDGSTSWGHIRYKKTGSGVSSVQMKPMSVAMGNHYYWNTASLEGYLADNLVDGTEYTGTITLSYTAGQAEAGKTPQLRYIVAAANTGEANLNLSNGTNTYTINLDSFVYDANAGKDDIMFELDSLEKGSIFQVTDITFTPTGWKNVPKNEEFTPTGTPWTLQSLNDGSTMWGEMQYRVDGTASNIANTTIKMTNPGGNNEWNFATLEDYLSDKMSAGHTYSCSIAYTVAGASSGNTMTIKVGNNDGSVESVQNGENTYAISSFEYDGTNTDILFMPDKLAKNATFKVTSISINQLDVGYENVPANVQGGFNPTDTPWRLTVTNDGSTSYGAMKYKVDGTPSNISNTKMRLVTNSGSPSYSWTSAKLPGYATTLGLETDFTYGGSIVINPEAEGIITVYVDGTAYTQDLSESHTIAIPDFVYKGDEPGAGGSSDIVFMFDQMVDGTDFSVSSINIDRIDTQEGFEKVPADQDFTPEGSIWTIKAANNSSTTWGKMWYKVDDTAEPTDIGNTTVRMINGNEEYKWDTMSLKNYINNDQLEGPELEKDKLYSATITYNYDPNPDSGNGKSGAGEDEVTATVCNADPVTATVTEGTGNTIAVGEFAYDGESNDIVFVLDGLKSGSEFTVTGIEFTESDWTRVPDNDPNFKIPVGYEYDFRDTDGVMRTKNSGTYDWTVFAGEWGGHGAILYYDNDFTKADQPKVRIGAGEKYDPACAQFKLPNTSAYQDLKYYTSYYMTYTFYSSEAGTVHITHEGYEPNHPERIDVVKGLNTYKKYVTRLPGQDYLNLYMSLTPTTYGAGGVIINDGTALPEGTVLSNFKVEFQKTDADVYTLVNDCRYEGYQEYTPIIDDDAYGKTVFFGYCNSNYEGWMSYDANTNETRSDEAIADTKIRLDSTNGNYGGGDISSNTWPEHIRIPNSYFYGNREVTTAAQLANQPVGTDTNGDPLEDGKEYLLRFYYNVDLPDGATLGSNKGIVMTREGYDGNSHTRYVAHEGLNMAGGTINPKNGYNANGGPTANGKSGGIPITYNDSKRTTQEQYNTAVQIDFSDFPAGTIISDIRWEFYTAQKFTAKVVDANDGTVYGDVETVAEGDTYTVPTVDGVTNYTYEGQPIQPGTNITVEDDIVIYVTRDANSHTVTILNPDNTVKKVDVVSDGGNYTFPQATGDYKNVKTFEAVSGATDDQAPGSTITNVTNDKVYKIANQYTVTIKDSDGTVLDTWTVDAGDSFQFPEDTGKYDGVKKFNGIVAEGTTGSYDPEAIIASVDKDLVFQVQREFKVIIDGVPVATVPEGDSYTFPAATGTYAGVDHFVDDDDQFYGPETTITPTGDVVVSSVYKVKIFDEDGTLMLSTDVSKGDNYTFPLATGEFADVKDFKGINGTSGTYNPGGQVTVNTNLNYQIEKKAATDHTITIYEKDGTTVRETITVEDGGSASLPDGNTPGYDDVASYLEGSTPRALGYTYTNVTEDISVKVVPYEYTITIVDANGDTLVSETHDAGYVYTFPTSIGQIDHIKDYKGIDGTTGTKLPTETVTLDSNKKYQVEELEQYTITIDGNVVDTVYEGETYTFPTPAHVTEFSDNDAPGTTYEPGQTITPDRNIDVDSVYETFTVKIVDTDGTTELKSTTVTYNDSYTFPTTAEQGFEHAKDFVGIAGSSATKTPGSTIDNVDRDMTFQIERQYTITIYNTDGTTVKDTFTVDEGADQTLPNNQTTGYENVKEYTDGQNTYPLGYTFENVQEDIEVQVVPYNYYNVYINGVQQQETVREGEGYTTPTDMPGVTKFIDTATQAEYNPGETVPNIQADLYLETVSATYYTWTVDGQPGGTVEAGTEITLPNTAAIGYLLAYTDGEDEGVTDDLYKPSAKYTVNRNVNFISINEVSMQQTDKVSMYYKQGENQRGIRFLSKLTVNEESDTNILSSDAFQTGMLICAEDTYYEMLDEELTLEKAEEFEYVVNAQNNSDKTRKWITGQPGSFSCGIVDVKDYNIPRNFLSRGYVIVNYVGGDSQVIYSDPSTPRSVKWIATQVFNDKTTYDKLPSWKKEIVDYCKDFEEE